MLFKIVIPARFGSSRLPGKPLLTINDKPMIWHVYQQALLTGIDVSSIVIATDNDEI
jgi:3-deoxy-manno-octulosonate cytidylyltransferase (CMP-KDO synthetase)